MALLDVSDILADPDFCETSGLSYVRNVQTVSAGGIASDAETTTAFSGVVCAADGSRMTRSETGEQVESNITIHTVTRLTAGGPAGTTPADLVVWKGARYTVVNVDDYSHFGAGFVAATCDLIPVAGA